MNRQRPVANPYPQQQPKPRPEEKIPSEGDYNTKFTSRQFHENDFVLPVCDREITPDEMIMIKHAWAKSYRINEKCVEIVFEMLDPDLYFKPEDKEILENYFLFCIDIKGNFDENKANSFKTDITKTRRCYSMLVPIPGHVKVEAEKRKMSSITSGTPLQTVYIGKPPEITAVAPLGRAPRNVPKKLTQ